MLGEYNNLGDFPVKTAQNIRSFRLVRGSRSCPSRSSRCTSATTATANTNSPHVRPNLIQALGDLSLGVKGALQVSKQPDSAMRGLFLGLDLRLLTFQRGRQPEHRPLRRRLQTGAARDLRLPAR